MKKNSVNYITLFLIIYSIYDYFEHILRPDSIFEEHPFDWLLYSISAVLSFIIIVYPVKYLIEKLLSKKNLFFEIIAIGIWLFLYLSIVGSLLNKVFWPHSELFFAFQFGPFFIILTLLFVVRITVNLFTKKKILSSN